jgi:DNA-binding NarL/FixJ family response regulator
MSQPTRPIRILLVEDSEQVLWGLGKLIDGEPHRMRVVGKARNVAEAFAGVREHEPDVVLLDIYLDEDNSLDYLPEMLRGSTARVLVLTGARDPEVHRRAIKLGACAVVTKEQPAQVLLDAIVEAHSQPAYRGAM